MFELMGTGENGSTWGTKANTVFQVLERFGNGVASITMNSATKTLTTATDYSLRDWHYAVFNLVSATQAANLVLPSKQKLFGVVNSATGAFTATVKTATGASVAVAQSERAILYNDGTDVRKLFYSGDWQPLDADLTAIAALASNGVLARTGSGTYAARTLTASGAGLAITNGTATGGNPVFALADDVAAIEGISGTGLAARTAANTWAARSIAAGAAIGVTNGTATGGNPTVAVDINGTTTATDAVATGDYLLMYDVSLGALRKATTSDVVGSAGGVTGPGSSTDNAWARWNGTGGTAVQNGTWVEDDAGDVTAGGDLDMAGNEFSEAVVFDSSGKHEAVGTTASNKTFDVSAYASGSIEPTGNITIAFSNWPASGDAYFTLEGTGLGDHTITWTGVTWDGGAAPTLSTTTGVDKLVFFTRDAGTTTRGKLGWST
jgi:hypothetical protein